MNKIQLIIATIIIAMIISFVISPNADAQTENITLLYSSRIADFDKKHTADNLAKLSTAIETERKNNPNTIFLHGGFSLGPNLLGGFDQGKHIIDYLNKLKPDAMGLGYLELSYGYKTLIERLTEARFPVINSDLLDHGKLNVIKVTTPYKIFNAGKTKIGVFSLQSEDSLSKFPIMGLKVTPTNETIEDYISLFKERDVQVVVALVDSNKALIETLEKNKKNQHYFEFRPR